MKRLTPRFPTQLELDEFLDQRRRTAERTAGTLPEDRWLSEKLHRHGVETHTRGEETVKVDPKFL